MAAAIGINVVAPPRHDQPALLQKFSFVDIRGAHAIAFLMAHLSFDGCVSP